MTGFDLALLDFEMPEMNGVELARRLKGLPAAASMPLLLASSSGTSRRDLVGAGDDPFAAFLSKPLKTRQLTEALRRVIDSVAAADRRAGAPIDSAVAQQCPLRILLAEDNGVNQKVAVHLLERMGYRPDVASNGLEALEAVRRQRYDVVLMDVEMPEMDASRRRGASWPTSLRPSVRA